MKVRFGDLKVGAKFRYKRCLYLKDDLCCGVRISNGSIADGRDLTDNTLVTPVKIKVEVIK